MTNIKFKFSRRDLLQGGAAMGAAKAMPKSGGKLRLGMGHGSTTDNYDPALWENAYAQVFATARHGNLTEVDSDGSLIGELAESWDTSDGGQTWHFKLRQGVEFHSGKTMDSEDVIASLNYHRGEESKSAAKPIVSPITEITADGKNAMKIVLSERNADFPFTLSDYHLAILPASEGKIDPTSSDGTGAYVVKNYDAGVSASMTRNPNYWKEGRAHFDEVELLVIADNSARLNAIISGEVDVIDRVDLSTINMLKRRNDLQVLATTGTQHYTFPMDTRAAPFSDNNVRMALKFALDRQEMVDKILNGYGQVGNDHPIGPSNRYFNTELPQRELDPDKAKYHLKQAGLSSLEVDLFVADAAFPGAVDAGVLYSEAAEKAGITVRAVREPDDGYWSNVWMKKPFCACYWGGRPTEDWMFSTAYSSGVPWNDTFWSNEKFDKLLVEARVELDDDRRRAMYYEMQEIVANEGGTIVPMYASYVMAHSNNIAHPDQVAANWTLDGFRAVERWWFT